MATLTVDQFLNQLETLSTIINTRETNLRLARKAKEIIYRRVKSGYGVTKDSGDSESIDRTSLKALSKSYIDYRKGLVIFRTGPSGNVYPINNKKIGRRKAFKAPTLGEFGRPSKSNLTLTGQMLNAIMTVASDGSFELYIASTSRRTPDGKLDKNTNKQVAEYVSKNGRPWFALTSGELRIITRELELIIQGHIRRLLGE